MGPASAAMRLVLVQAKMSTGRRSGPCMLGLALLLLMMLLLLLLPLLLLVEAVVPSACGASWAGSHVQEGTKAMSVSCRTKSSSPCTWRG